MSHLWFIFVLESMLSSEYLELLIDFLAYLQRNKKQRCGTHCTPTNANANTGYVTPQDITGPNSPWHYVRELFKPSNDGTSLVLCNKRSCFNFGCRFFGLRLHDGRIFMHILFRFWWSHHSLGTDKTSRFCGSTFFGFLSVIRVFRALDRSS